MSEHEEIKQDIAKVWIAATSGIAASWKLADIQILLSIAVLSLTLAYTAFKFYRDIKLVKQEKEVKNENQS